MNFDEDAVWKVVVPPPETYAGDLYYFEGDDRLTLGWEFGTGDPYAFIYADADDFDGPFPLYALNRIAEAFQKDFLEFPTTSDINASVALIRIFREETLDSEIRDAEQASSSNGGQRSSSNSGFHPRRDELDVRQ